MTSLGGDAGPVHARRVRNVTEYLAGGAFDGDIVRATVSLNIELFNLERLRVPGVGRGQHDCEKNRRCGQ